MDGQPRSPHGRGSGRSATGEEARQLLVSAFTKVASQRGYASTTPDEVTAAADLPAGSFDEHFEGISQCLLIAFDRFVADLAREIEETVDLESLWPEQVRDGVEAALAFVAERAEIARVFVTEAAVAGPALVDRYEDGMDAIAALLRLGRGREGGRPDLPELTERVLVAGAASLVIEALLSEDRERILSLRPRLAEVLLLPYEPAIR